jgi:hypothetical protein
MNYRSVSSFDQEKLVVYIRNLQYPLEDFLKVGEFYYKRNL